jgi:hypothetical protein
MGAPTFAFKPNLQMASQSALDCSDAAGEVNSICAFSVSTDARAIVPSLTHIVNTEIIQSLGDLDLLGGVKESIGELFALSQSALNDLEIRDVAQEVADGLVWV